MFFELSLIATPRQLRPQSYVTLLPIEKYISREKEPCSHVCMTPPREARPHRTHNWHTEPRGGNGPSEMREARLVRLVRPTLLLITHSIALRYRANKTPWPTAGGGSLSHPWFSFENVCQIQHILCRLFGKPAQKDTTLTQKRESPKRESPTPALQAQQTVCGGCPSINK